MDVAWSADRGTGSLRWLVRDHDGCAILGGCKFISKGIYMSLLEVEAILEGLRVLVGAWSGPITCCEVKFDALEVISSRP